MERILHVYLCMGRTKDENDGFIRVRVAPLAGVWAVGATLCGRPSAIISVGAQLCPAGEYDTRPYMSPKIGDRGGLPQIQIPPSWARKGAGGMVENRIIGQPDRMKLSKESAMLACGQYHEARKWGFHKGQSPFGGGLGVPIAHKIPPKSGGKGDE